MEFSCAQNIKIIWTSFSSLASISRISLLEKIPPKFSWTAAFLTNFLMYLILKAKNFCFSCIKCKKGKPKVTSSVFSSDHSRKA